MAINDAADPLVTWKLTPMKLLNPQWAFSTYAGEAYVRASSELIARRFAAAQFASDLSEISSRSPWFFVVLVTAEIVEDERFASIGAPGVVFPRD